MNKARITYRFDHRDGRFVDAPRSGDRDDIISLEPEDFEVVEEPRERPADSIRDSYWLNQFTRDYGAWQSPFDAETERLEQLIRESDSARRQPPRASAYAKDQAEPQPARNGAYDEAGRRADERYEWGEAGARSIYRKKGGFPWFKMTSSVTGAIVTGVLFGFLALSWFGGHGAQSDTGSLYSAGLAGADGTALEDGGASGADSADGAQSPASAPADASGAVPVHISAQTYYLLQNGVFSNQEGADSAKSQLRRKGFAAVAEGADNYSVYAGVTVDRNDALWLSHRLEESQFEVYIKTLTLPEIHQLRWNAGDGQELDQFVAGGSDLVGAMESMTIRLLEDEHRASIDASAIDSLRMQHQTWLDLENALSKGAPPESSPALDDMVNAMNTAMISLEEYNKNPSEAALWQTQTELMEYVLAEQHFLTSLSQ